MILAGSVNGFDVKFELDSGADISLASPDIVLPSDTVVSHSIIKGVYNKPMTVSMICSTCVHSRCFRQMYFCNM